MDGYGYDRMLWKRTVGLLTGRVTQHGGWLRLGSTETRYGWGLLWASSLISQLYSERTGRRRYLRIGPWRLRVLRPAPRITYRLHMQTHQDAQRIADEVVRRLGQRVMTRR
jgi:hypothetical protein